MRASKENARRMLQRMEYLRRSISSDGDASQQIDVAITEVEEFLAAAKRKLPSDAAYERDRSRATS